MPRKRPPSLRDDPAFQVEAAILSLIDGQRRIIAAIEDLDLDHLRIATKHLDTAEDSLLKSVLLRKGGKT